MSLLRTWLTRLRIAAMVRGVERADSLRDLQRLALRRHAGAAALATPTVRWTYREVEDRVLRLAGAWRAAGARKGARVVVLLPDEWPQLVVRFAATETGVVLVGFTPAHSAALMAQAVRDLAPTLLMVDVSLAPAGFVEAHVAAGGAPIWDCGPDGDLEARLAAATPTASDEAIGPDDALALGFTSGTSGTPKMLALKHAPYLHSVRLLLLNLDDPPRGRSRMLVGIPLSGAGSGVVLPTLLGGGELILPRAYTADALIEALRAERPSHLFVTPSLLIDLLDHPDLTVADMACLRQVIYGTATMPVAKLREALARFGAIFQQGYGMSEALPPIAMLPPDAHVDDGLEPQASVLSSSGAIARGVGLEVRHDDDRVAAAGAIGRIWVRTPTVFEGYVGRADLNRDVLRDGWYCTGDHGYFDAAGRIHVLDRQQNLIERPQGRLYPRLVEDRAHECRHVKEAALVQARGQVWLCVSLRRASRGLDPAQVERDLRDRLAAALPDWQRPDRLLVLDELPRSFLAKLLHREVRDGIERGALGGGGDTHAATQTDTQAGARA